MSDTMPMGFGLAGLPLLSDAETRSICAENPKGEKGAGGTVENHLGAGWKGRPCIRLPKDQTTPLAEIVEKSPMRQKVRIVHRHVRQQSIVGHVCERPLQVGSFAGPTVRRGVKTRTGRVAADCKQ